MKKLLTLMFVLVAFIFCARSVKAQQSISPKIINLETIYTGEPLSFDFILTNNSDVPVSITSVSLPTAKLKVNYSDDPIPAKGVGVIKMTLFTQDLTPGILNKTIRIRTNGNPSSFRLTIKGEVSNEIPLEQKRNDGLLWVRTYFNGKYGAKINSQIVIAPKYDNLSYYRRLDRFVGLLNNELTLLDLGGKILFRSDFQEFFPDELGVIVKNNSSMGYIDKSGNAIIPFTAGYKKLAHNCNNKIGEYFRFDRDDTSGILDSKGNVTFELPKLPNGQRMIAPYYIGNKLLYVSNDGIYDKNRNKIASLNYVANSVFDMPFIDENGDILLFLPTENDAFAKKKLGSVYNLSCQHSENPYKQ